MHDTMARSVLPETEIHPTIRSRIAALYAEVVGEVIPGMAGAPFPTNTGRLHDSGELKPLLG